MSLDKIGLKTGYRKSAGDWIVGDFLIPVLSEAVSYKRAVGYFSSSALVDVSQGISQLFNNNKNAVIQLVASPALSDEDVEAIRKGQDQKEIIERALERELVEPIDHFDEERLNLLANLIADGKLEIKIAILKGPGRVGIFHEKIGIVEDNEGNVVSFTGSMNATGAGHYANYESVDVFCSWKSEESLERCEEKKSAFEQIWLNEDDQLEVRSFSKIEDCIIKKYKDHLPNYRIDSEQYGERYVKKDIEPKGARVPETVELHDYQKEAIAEWAKNDYCGIFDMATGTGKTYTGLGGIAKLSQALDDQIAVFIVCPLQHLVEQWVEDIEKFGMDPIIGYSSSSQKDWKNRLSSAIRDQKVNPKKPFFCFVTTNDTFASPFVQKSINRIKVPILLVADEAHNFGANSFIHLLDDRFTYRLALSATLERYGDEAGTEALLDFFGKKCIQYSLGRAINEDKLTPYYYYPVLVYLNEDELSNYEQLSFEMYKHIKTNPDGTTKLDSRGEIIAIKRSRIVAAASEKLNKLKEVIEPYKMEHFILVYCGATNVYNPKTSKTTTDERDIKQIMAVADMLGNDLGMKVAKFTSEESVETRNSIKEHFKNGDELQVIAAIKCLDEGVNIPGIKTAFILASTTNPKEYIQRRGRVLRKSPETGKKFAEIFDFITLPRPLAEVPGLTIEQKNRDLSLVKNELRRMEEFATLSDNPMEANGLMLDIVDTYDLNDFYLELKEEKHE